MPPLLLTPLASAHLSNSTHTHTHTHIHSHTFCHINPASQASELAVQLLLVPKLQNVAQLLSKFSATAVARVMYIFMEEDTTFGPKACAQLLECMQPTFAVR
jgi:hypothetical protein